MNSMCCKDLCSDFNNINIIISRPGILNSGEPDAINTILKQIKNVIKKVLSHWY